VIVKRVTTDEAAALWGTRTGSVWTEQDEARAEFLRQTMQDGSFNPVWGRGVLIENGRLVNGRHRMRAVMLLGKPTQLAFEEVI